MVSFYTCYILFVLVYTKTTNGQCLMITDDEIGNSTGPSATGLISQARGLKYYGGRVSPKIHVLAYNIVCTSVFRERDTFRSISLVANYTELTHGDSTSQFYSSQFEFGCEGNAWSSRSDNHGITTPPDANFSTPLREDCGLCIKGNVARDSENHCSGNYSLPFYCYCMEIS